MNQRNKMRRHANERACLRYGIRLTNSIREQLSEAVLNNIGLVRKSGRNRAIYEVVIDVGSRDRTSGDTFVGATLIRFVWDRELKEIVTVLNVGQK